MKTINKSTAIFIAKNFILSLLFFTIIVSCKKGSELKDDDDIDTPDFSSTYIPQPGFVYTYKLTTERGETYQILKGNYGIKDSIGIKVSDIRSILTIGAETINQRYKMYDLDGFTITETYLMSEWDSYVNQMRELYAEDGGAVLECTTTGLPFSMFMDKYPQVGSVLKFSKPTTNLYLKVRSSRDTPDILETKQTITRYDGTAVRLEKLSIPAGEFDCTVWEYEVHNKVELFRNGVLTNTLNTKDKITLWTKLGIGDVLVTTENEEGISTVELVRINR